MRIIRFLDERLEEILLVLLLVAMTCCMGVNIILRYVFSSSMVWVDEFCRYTFIASCFVSASYGIRKNDMICMSSVKEMLPPAGQKLLSIVSDLLLAVVFGYFSWCGIDNIRAAVSAGLRSSIMSIPIYSLYVIAEIGYVLALFRSIQKLFRDYVRKGDDA